MPRKARIDAQGALRHIIIRGIERWRMFRDDQDRDNFVERRGEIVSGTKTFGGESCGQAGWEDRPNRAVGA
jgi:putative transposase